MVGAMKTVAAEAYPLYWPEGWKRTAYRRRSAFKVNGFGRVRDLLLAEVRRMGGSSIVLSSNITLRLDGLPYANQAQPSDPGIAVYFMHKKRQMTFACDAWLKVEENAYAIAKTIEALRGIERWGASDMMERAFTGFAALPAQASSTWREQLGFSADDRVVIAEVEERFRELAKLHHPDFGGDPAKFREITEARAAARLEFAA